MRFTSEMKSIKYKMDDELFVKIFMYARHYG
jgi:hypothetical protein